MALIFWAATEYRHSEGILNLSVNKISNSADNIYRLLNFPCAAESIIYDISMGIISSTFDERKMQVRP